MWLLILIFIILAAACATQPADERSTYDKTLDGQKIESQEYYSYEKVQ